MGETEGSSRLPFIVTSPEAPRLSRRQPEDKTVREEEKETLHNGEGTEQDAPEEPRGESPAVSEENEERSQSTNSCAAMDESEEGGPTNGHRRSQFHQASSPPKLTNRRAPRVAAYRRSLPRDREEHRTKKLFLRPEEVDDPEWWKSVLPQTKLFTPTTNAVPDNVVRHVDNSSVEDNVWRHLYESGLDAEKRKLFHASPNSFREMSKMWEGFKVMAEESREVTVPTYTNATPWNRSLRFDPSTSPQRNKSRSPQRSTSRQQTPSKGRSASRGASSTQPRQKSVDNRSAPATNKSPWYAKRETTMRTMSSAYLKSSNKLDQERRREAASGNRRDDGPRRVEERKDHNDDGDESSTTNGNVDASRKEKEKEDAEVTDNAVEDKKDEEEEDAQKQEQEGEGEARADEEGASPPPKAPDADA